MYGDWTCSSRNGLGSVGDLAWAWAWASELVLPGQGELLGLIGCLLEVGVCAGLEAEAEADEAEMAAGSCHLSMCMGSVACW